MRLAVAVLFMLSACGGPHHTERVAGRELCDAWAADRDTRPYFQLERVVIRASDRFEPPRCTYSIGDDVTLAVVHDGAGVDRWERDGDLLIAHVEHVLRCESCPETCQAVARGF
ncbi:MAG TPA: hypothetical protein VLB44_24400, partial [Kofleriaceae bacterium]|nr:hypothetical protein [Kofleriaceae bacterium]